MSLLQMSISGAVMILVIVVIRALAINKLPKRAFLVLWGIVLTRLLIPYSLPSAFSIYSLRVRFAGGTDTLRGVPTVPPMFDAPAQGAAAGGSAVSLWTGLWLVGVIALSVFFAAAYFKSRREFRESLPVESERVKAWLGAHSIRRPMEIRQSDRISAPLTYGVFRPVILMPKTTDWDDLDTLGYVLEHEYVHIRRLDAVIKLLLTAALCIHWYDPAVWVMYVIANRDIEISCDEAVIRRFGERTKSAYAMTLIRMEETRSGILPLGNNFSKNAIEERIIAIMKSKKTSFAALVAAMALVLVVATVFATSGQAQAAEDAYGSFDVSAAAEQDIEAATFDLLAGSIDGEVRTVSVTIPDTDDLSDCTENVKIVLGHDDGTGSIDYSFTYGEWAPGVETGTVKVYFTESTFDAETGEYQQGADGINYVIKGASTAEN